MLLSYFVLIKLSVIKCLFNYDIAIIINIIIYKIQVKFINQSKIVLIVSLACLIFWIILPSYQHCNFCIYFLDLTYYYINLIIYIVCSRAAPGFCFEGNITQNFIHNFLPSPVLQWRRQNFGSGEGHSAQMYSSKTFDIF